MGARRSDWVNTVWPLGLPGWTGSSEGPAWTGRSQKTAGYPRASLLIETLVASEVNQGNWRGQQPVVSSVLCRCWTVSQSKYIPSFWSDSRAVVKVHFLLLVPEVLVDQGLALPRPAPVNLRAGINCTGAVGEIWCRDARRSSYVLLLE